MASRRIFEMGPKPAKRDLHRSVTERPAKSDYEKGDHDANGGTKREWICSMADTGSWASLDVDGSNQ